MSGFRSPGIGVHAGVRVSAREVMGFGDGVTGELQGRSNEARCLLLLSPGAIHMQLSCPAADSSKGACVWG